MTKGLAWVFVLLVAAASMFGCVREEPVTLAPEASTSDADEGTRPFIDAFTASKDDVVVAGDIYQEVEERPDTVLLIVGGSNVGPRTDVAPFAPIIIDDNIAVAVFDRRGTGQSSGEYTIPNTLNSEWLVPLLASDVALAVTHLKSAGFRNVGLLGSSFGGWVDTAAAAQSKEIDFIINISGGGSSVGVSDYFDALTDDGASIADATNTARSYDGPSGYDPSDDLMEIEKPGLWIFGDMDDSNPTVLDAENVRALEARKDFRVVVLPNVNHDLVDLESGEMTMAWLEIVRDFVKSQD